MAEQIITKTCGRCKQVKPISEFHKNNATKSGYKSACKICRKKYEKNEKSKELARKRQRKHSKTAKRKTYFREYMQNWRKTEKGKYNKKQGDKSYRFKYPEKYQAGQNLNYAIRCGKLPRPDTLRCSCGKQAEQYHHHKGYAPEHWLNVIPVCHICHNILHQRESSNSNCLNIKPSNSRESELSILN